MLLQEQFGKYLLGSGRLLILKNGFIELLPEKIVFLFFVFFSALIARGLSDCVMLQL